MKAIVWTAYGPPDVLKLREVRKPDFGDNEVLVRNHATTVTAGDCEVRTLKFPIWLRLPMRIYIGLRKPTRVTIPGTELAGEIEAVGKDVTRFKIGDQVFGSTGFGFGAYAQFVSLPEASEDSVLGIIPTNMTYEEAVAVTLGGLDALHFLRKGSVQSGEKVLIHGAGGSIGTFAVQLAKYFGAEVTAVDSEKKLGMLRMIGADHVIDYAQKDFTKNGETYDVIFDVIGKSSFSRSIRSLNPNGRYLLANPRMTSMIRGLWTSKTSSKDVIFQFADHKIEDLIYLKGLCEAGVIRTIIDRRYPLEQVPEAHVYVETGQKTGNVIITVEHNN